MTSPVDDATLDALMAACGSIAQRAADEILDVDVNRDGAWSEKGDGSPVTEADLRSNHTICRALQRLTPRVPVVSEENAASHQWVDRDVYWLVDPLDGTKEFVKGLAEYTVNIALIEQASAVLGVILVPPSGVLYSARRRGGAHRRLPGRDAEPIHARTCGQGIDPVAAVSRSHRSPRTAELLQRIGVHDVVRCGSSLKMCAVAEGNADIYPRLGPTWYWDTAAGAAIAGEAGCTVVDLEGKPLSYGRRPGPPKHPGFLVCGKGIDKKIHDMLHLS